MNGEQGQRLVGERVERLALLGENHCTAQRPKDEQPRHTWLRPAGRPAVPALQAQASRWPHSCLDAAMPLRCAGVSERHSYSITGMKSLRGPSRISKWWRMSVCNCSRGVAVAGTHRAPAAGFARPWSYLRSSRRRAARFCFRSGSVYHCILPPPQCRACWWRQSPGCGRAGRAVHELMAAVAVVEFFGGFAGAYHGGDGWELALQGLGWVRNWRWRRLRPCCGGGPGVSWGAGTMALVRGTGESMRAR